MSAPRIVRVSGPATQAGGATGLFMGEVVRVGPRRLTGEIIRIDGDVATIQVYEDTTGLAPGDPVERTGEPLTVELGPGLLGGIFDGIQRPLGKLAEVWGDYIARGASVYRLDHDRLWRFTPTVRPGDHVAYNHVVGVVSEAGLAEHKIMVPAGIEGTVASVADGELPVTGAAVTLTNGQVIQLRQKCSVRKPRPQGVRLPLARPLLTGQRVVDTLFPVAEGGAAIIPGGFGSGKTVLEQTIAKYAEADIIIYIGCGERGNEMADALHDLAHLTDPRSGRPLLERTILIANTSNMPVAAREASIYTGVTIAEYYRDMGLRVAVLADSTSRWAEALREMSSRLEEIPGEEGYPTYLSSRLGAFYERAGRIRVAGRPDETGSVTLIGAVSPPGGDFSEPVTQASLRTASTFWALDYGLAHQRHFPAIDWRISFSLAYPSMLGWYARAAGRDWEEMTRRLNELLQREEELTEIARVVGMDAMEEKEKAALEIARIIREGYLRQSAVHPVDAFCSLAKQRVMLSFFLEFADGAARAVARGARAEDIFRSPAAEAALRLKETPDDRLAAAIESARAMARDAWGAAERHA